MAKKTTKPTVNEADQKSGTSSYDVQRESWIHGRHYDKGAKVSLTGRQAAPFLRDQAIKMGKKQNGGD